MDKIKTFDLKQRDLTQLHFEVRRAEEHFDKNKQHSSLPHRHNFYQLIWFKEAGQHYIDYQVVPHRDDTIIFINKNQVHYFCPDAKNVGYLYHFNDQFINMTDDGLMSRFENSIFSEIGSNYLTISKKDASNFELLTSFILNELNSKESFYKEQIYHYFQNILFQVERLRQKELNINLKQSENYLIAAGFKKLVSKEISTFHKIKYYAEELATNTKTLTESSKEFLKDTPSNVIKKSKVIEAKRQLSNLKISIQEVAYGLGFEDPAYFTKYFKKEVGLTPKAFQKAFL
jgi:AraC-like DNA-binding protein